MYQTYPVYYPSARYAMDNSEIELWRESHKINKECKELLNEKASLAYHDRQLPEFISELTDTFGLERAMFVVARTIVGAEWDGRYYRDVKARASLFDFADMKEAATQYANGNDPHRTGDSTINLCSNVHPVMLNDIFRCLMKMEKEQVNLPSADISQGNELSEGVDR